MLPSKAAARIGVHLHFCVLEAHSRVQATRFCTQVCRQSTRLRRHVAPWMRPAPSMSIHHTYREFETLKPFSYQNYLFVRSDSQL